MNAIDYFLTANILRL